MLIHLWEKLRFYLFGYEKFNKTVVWWILHGYVTRYITTCVQFFVQIKYTRYITMYSLESFRGSRERSRRQKVSNGIPLSSRVTAKNKGRMFFSRGARILSHHAGTSFTFCPRCRSFLPRESNRPNVARIPRKNDDHASYPNLPFFFFFLFFAFFHRSFLLLKKKKNLAQLFTEQF